MTPPLIARRPLWLLLTPIAIAADDAVRASRPWGVAAVAMLDEPAHLATAAVIVLSGAQTWRRRHDVTFRRALFAAAVLIDLDHVPLYAGVRAFDAGSRPPTHSLASVVALLAASVIDRRRSSLWRGCGAGVALHLVRDIATGPGVPLVWPISAAPVRVPYVAYLAALFAAAAVGVRGRQPARVASA